MRGGKTPNVKPLPPKALLVRVEGVLVSSLSIQGNDIHDAVQRFRTLYPRGKIETINGVDVAGFCEACESPIYEADEYHADEDGVLICDKCST